MNHRLFLTIFALSCAQFSASAVENDAEKADADNADKKRLEAAKTAFNAKNYDDALEQLEPILKRDPENDPNAMLARRYASTILHVRGEDHFRKGKMKASVADFDRQLSYDSAYTPRHWQRGISLYYAGEYQRGVEQFEVHQTVNPQDVENAVWHFLCAVRAPGGTVEAARKDLIPIQSDTRVPMKEVHQLFAGNTTPDAVLAAGEKGGNGGRFYADLYVGLYFEAVGEDEKALQHITKAAENPSAGHYMGDVARSHLIVRNREKAAGDDGKKSGDSLPD